MILGIYYVYGETTTSPVTGGTEKRHEKAKMWAGTIRAIKPRE
jgi:hypothetical protein